MPGQGGALTVLSRQSLARRRESGRRARRAYADPLGGGTRQPPWNVLRPSIPAIPNQRAAPSSSVEDGVRSSRRKSLGRASASGGAYIMAEGRHVMGLRGMGSSLVSRWGLGETAPPRHPRRGVAVSDLMQAVLQTSDLSLCVGLQTGVPRSKASFGQRGGLLSVVAGQPPASRSSDEGREQWTPEPPFPTLAGQPDTLIIDSSNTLCGPVWLRVGVTFNTSCLHARTSRDWGSVEAVVCLSRSIRASSPGEQVFTVPSGGDARVRTRFASRAGGVSLGRIAGASSRDPDTAWRIPAVRLAPGQSGLPSRQRLRRASEGGKPQASPYCDGRPPWNATYSRRSAAPAVGPRTGDEPPRPQPPSLAREAEAGTPPTLCGAFHCDGLFSVRCNGRCAMQGAWGLQRGPSVPQACSIQEETVFVGVCSTLGDVQVVGIPQS
ncbi:hypothetical protein Bbelb_362190 [Branchiostoma belcheri]|nr:hypothetical protein Bbelb_362190 [Branchiostoma belcheri]